MMQGISGGMQMMHSARTESKMSNEQSEKLSSLLETYDSDSLSDDDAKKLVSEIKELGIQPGSDLTNALSESGIDARGLADQAGVGKGGEGGRPPPPHGGGQGSKGVESVDDAAVSLISDAVAAYEESTDETESLQSILLSAMEEAGYDASEPLISFYA